MKTMNVALYIGADPLSFNDINLIKNAIKSFGFVYIILDRMNRDYIYQTYYLNYTNRSDIIKHDLKELKITNYKLIPIDISLETTLKENEIDILLLDLDYQISTDFLSYKIIKRVNPNINIHLISGNKYIEHEFIRKLIDCDPTISIYKDYCSDYLFNKLKFKNIKKLGVIGNIDNKDNLYIQMLESNGFTILNIDELLGDYKIDDKSLKILLSKINILIADKMKSMFNNRFAIIFSKLEEFNLKSLFDKTIQLNEINSTAEFSKQLNNFLKC